MRDPYEVAPGADALVVITEWNEFKQLDWERIRETMRRRVVIDGRNLWDPHQLEEMGFSYYGIGRGAWTNSS